MLSGKRGWFLVRGLIVVVCGFVSTTWEVLKGWSGQTAGRQGRGKQWRQWKFLWECQRRHNCHSGPLYFSGKRKQKGRLQSQLGWRRWRIVSRKGGFGQPYAHWRIMQNFMLCTIAEWRKCGTRNVLPVMRGQAVMGFSHRENSECLDGPDSKTAYFQPWESIGMCVYSVCVCVH